MKDGVIRPIAICLFSRDGRILAAEGYEPARQQTFYRPLGGEIEFGETGAQAVVRELREELGAEVRDLRFLGTLENLYTFDGRPGHEIVLVYDGALADRTLYEREVLHGAEDDGQPFRARWVPAAAGPGEPPLYPEGLASLLRAPAGSDD
jgi:8-oxo-dGTP pyrophosphatase MutT (NUDIX family)